MGQRYVIILSTRGLFREGLNRLLAEVATVASAASPEEVEELLHSQPVDAVIIDREDNSVAHRDFVCHLLFVPNTRVITVGLDVRDIQIYQHEQVAQASPEALISAVVGQYSANRDLTSKNQRDGCQNHSSMLAHSYS